MILWKIYLTSRYGSTKDLGFIWWSENVPWDCIKSNPILPKINDQSCALSFDIINRKKKHHETME